MGEGSGKWPSWRLDFVASREGHHCPSGAAVGNEVGFASNERAREPPTALALIRLEPANGALKTRVGGGHVGLSQREQREAGAVAVSRRLLRMNARGRS